MITVTKFAQQTVGILGLGKTGTAVVTSLLKGNAKVICWDDKISDFKQWHFMDKATHNLYHQNKPLIDPPYEQYLPTLQALVVSPGISQTHPILTRAKELKIPILSDFDLLYDACPLAKYIGITGTNGKSTTTALITHIIHEAGLPVQMGGNIGIPALSLSPFSLESSGIYTPRISRIGLGDESVTRRRVYTNTLEALETKSTTPKLESPGVYVLESSSFQLELSSQIKFHIAICLNLTPDHLDRHHTMKNYTAAKLKIFERQQRDDYAIVSTDSIEMLQIYQQLSAENQQKIIPISVEQRFTNSVAILDDTLYDDIEGGSSSYHLGFLKYLRGIHNMQNIAAGYAACRAIGIEGNIIISAIKSFKGLAHRMELVLEHKNLQFINDSKATNTDAARQALSSFEDIIWIAGGIFKEESLNSLVPFFSKIRHAYLIGKDAAKFADILSAHNVPNTMIITLQEAMIAIKNQSYDQGVVLLSPACASFDQWEGYEHRGEEFKKMVLQLFK